MRYIDSSDSSDIRYLYPRHDQYRKKNSLAIKPDLKVEQYFWLACNYRFNSLNTLDFAFALSMTEIPSSHNAAGLSMI